MSFLQNEKIKNFYNSNKELNFEKINLLLIDLFENNNNPNKNFLTKNNINFKDEKDFIYNLFLNNSNNNIEKVKSIEFVLSKIFPNDEISKSNDSHIILKRENKNTIFIQNEEQLYNIDNTIVSNFIEIIKQNNTSGILISQYSGIIGKPNFSFDIINNNIILYIHNCNFDIDKIKTAIEVFDNIYKINSKDIMINKDILNNIYQEYEYFVNYKQTLIKLIQNDNNNIINYIKNINFDKLNSNLFNDFKSTTNVNFYTCNICNIYISNTLKGLAAHKKGCKRKYCNKINENNVNNVNNETNQIIENN